MIEKIIKFNKIPFRPKTSKRCNLTERKNDDNEIGLEENAIPSHENKSHIESGVDFVQLVMPTAMQNN